MAYGREFIGKPYVVFGLTRDANDLIGYRFNLFVVVPTGGTGMV